MFSLLQGHYQVSVIIIIFWEVLIPDDGLVRPKHVAYWYFRTINLSCNWRFLYYLFYNCHNTMCTIKRTKYCFLHLRQMKITHIPKGLPYSLCFSFVCRSVSCNDGTFAYDNLKQVHGIVIFEKQMGSQLVKKFLTFYRTQRLITMFTTASHMNPANIFPSYFLKVHFNIIWSSLWTLQIFPSSFPDKICINSSSRPDMPCTVPLPLYPPLFDHRNEAEF
jgi:hypothetical protein